MESPDLIQEESRMRREMGWPAAAALITAMVGAAATTFAWAISPKQHDRPTPAGYASAREIGEVKARLTAIEHTTYEMRTELRSDIKDLRTLVQQILKQK